MYIKSMVLDGFKSYAQRTEINGFDPLFNAITGLNGSGKSNILDGICFLLGITNLSHVRAGSLQELVFKNGQAGVTKATVSITFDNTDKKQSPLGYEQYDELTITRQVVVGGRNRYLVNGSNANNTRVQDLFRSVQLNVNNPHFLIMQGRITKVLNMKPPEILSMVEEAAGTRLYESKKENAQKTIEKKDAKLREIDNLLNEEITPTLTKLKDERASYLEYQKVIRELEHVSKLCIAYQFVCAEETKVKSADEQATVQENIAKLTTKRQENEKRIVELETEITELERKRDSETGGALKKLEADLAEKQKSEAKMQSALTNKKDSLRAEEKKRKDLDKRRANEDSVMQTKSKELENLRGELDKLMEQSKTDMEAFTAAQKHLQAVNAGLATAQDGGEDATLGDQLIAAKTEVSNAETQLQQSKMTLQHAKEELKKKSSEVQNTEQTYKKDKEVYDSTAKTVGTLEAEMNKLGYEEGKVERLRADKKRLASELQNIREKLSQLESRYPQLSFNYKDPENNFDRSAVHGLVVRLVEVKDMNFATALEVSAGGRLYNVVVDTEQTGKKLLQRGELKRRYTIIPLNKISARPIDNSLVRLAEQQVGKENVRTALSLVGYERQLQTAMEYVFGGNFVCSDMNSAKKVTFDKRINKKSVTLDGDSFDPAGLLSGGARQVSACILLRVAEAKHLFDEYTSTEKRLAEVDRELQGTERLYARWYEVKQRLDLKRQDLQSLEDRLKQSTHGQRLTEIDTLKATVVEQETLAKDSKDAHNRATKRAAELEYKLKNADAEKEREMKTAKAEIDRAKKVADASAKKTKEKEQQVESNRLELEEFEKEAGSADAQAEAIREAISGYEKQIEELIKTAEDTKLAVEEAKEAVTKHKELLNGCNRGITECQTKQRNLQKENHAAELELNELNHKVTKNARDAKDAARLVEQMLAEYSWIMEEKKFFGVANSVYDFETNDPREAQRRMQKLAETRDRLSKSVNMRAMNMLGKAEENYNDLMKKRKIVLNDKKKIEAVIAELDEKKKEALKKAYEQVTKDFGSIFSSLLPGSKAKLVAPEGMTILDGLEFKIAFGDVWKESLSELSGGQRSLVALSLILSLLLFKPAPLYILDEVDAALDLSHTQNIGQMLRSHFRHSQFIVVSLKDGMFNNANVLFKTKFVDGLSTVTRIASHNRTTAGDETSGKRQKK